MIVTPNQALYPDTKLVLRDKVLGEVEKNSFIALPGNGGHSGLTPSKLCPNLELAVRSFTVMVQRGCDQLVDFLLIGWW